jgi:DNA-binding response OmpR family regulator
VKIPTSEEEKSRTRTNNIIMVDNEPDVNITIKTALEENGDFKVDTYNDAESALFGFKSDYYDLAILDIRMPGTNGFQLCRKLKKIDKKIKICFLTAAELAYLHEIDTDIINDLSTDCFVAKPVNTTDLIKGLKGILSRE